MDPRSCPPMGMSVRYIVPLGIHQKKVSKIHKNIETVFDNPLLQKQCPQSKSSVNHDERHHRQPEKKQKRSTPDEGSRHLTAPLFQSS